MKKAAELSILCGINVSLIYTDLNNTIHHYSNNDAVLFKLSDGLKNQLGDTPNYAKYNNTDVSGSIFMADWLKFSLVSFQ